MPTLKENIDYWENEYPWNDEGNEWSGAWGNPATQWFGSILPRIQEYLPVRSLLEIAPGYGRWTKFLYNYCTTLQAVDMSKKCVDYCKNKYQHLRNIIIYQNDGKSLDMIANNSIDFIFSFDSFVHFNKEITDCYIKELSKKLKFGGIGFVHHSNIGSHFSYILNSGWRSNDVSHQTFADTCNNNGLQCISQELVTWGDNRESLTDCFSLFTKSKNKIEPRITSNFLFIDEIELIRNTWNDIF